MKHVTGTKKRMIGVTLAALTLVAGMSAVAFAGEPDIPAAKRIPAQKATAGEFVVRLGTEDRKLNSDDGSMEETEMTVLIAAEGIKTKVDEETGVMYYSTDEGKTWNEMKFTENIDSDDIQSIPATVIELVTE